MNINERIKHLRTTLKLSQVDFAKSIYLSDSYIAEMENGNRRINDRIIHLVSLTFGVNEAWLKNGEGNMFFTTPEEKLRRMTTLFNELPPRFQDYVLVQIEQLLALTE